MSSSRLDWGKEGEFLQSVFMRGHSEHSRRFYWSGLRRFHAFWREENVKEVNNRNVYEVLNSFVRWNDAKQVRARNIRNYVCSVKRFLLYEDVEIEENRFRTRPQELLTESTRYDAGRYVELLEDACRTITAPFEN